MTQATRYIHGHSWGTIHRPNSPAGDLVVNDETYEDMRAGFETLTSEGYYPPILRAHQPDKQDGDTSVGGGKEPRAIRDGFTYGRVVDLVRSDSERADELRDNPDIKTPDKGGVWYGIRSAEGVGDLIDKGFIDQWSPSVYRGVELPHPEMAEGPLEAVPRHLAFVSKSYQKNLEGSDYYKDDIDEMGEPIDGNPHIQAFGEKQDPFVVDRPDVTEEMNFPLSFVEESMSDDSNDGLQAIQETLDQVANTLEANATAYDEMAGAVEERFEAIEDRIDRITEELGEDFDEDEGKSEREKRLKRQVDDLSDAVDERESRIEELQKRQAEELAERAGLDLDDENADEVIEMAADDPLAFAQKLVNSQRQSSQSGPRPTKGGSGDDGTTTEEFSDKGEKREYVVEEYGVTPGSEEFIEKYETKFDGESPYDFD